MQKSRRTTLGFGVALAVMLLSSGVSAKPRAFDFDWVAPEFMDVTVHDPSVLKTDGWYYIFGSHAASAKSTDLVQWEQVSDVVSVDNPLFDNVYEELAETFAWAESDTLWAADVIELGDGKFYMYYNSCRGDSPRSAMGIAVADDVEGYYYDQGIFLRSGMWGLPSEDGTIYDPWVHPNTVDPDTFFDLEGRLWTVYGSYSGGIFILEMDPTTGFPLPGQGYGQHLMGGNHARIEGAYVLFSPESSYYYLFTSFGGLAADGGYNIRVARATAPEGPYFDAEGNDMSTVKSDASLPLFDDASIEPYGVKLMGSHLFERKIGEEGTGPETGYVSPGHNSAYYDEATGQYFLIFHTRFPGTGEFHQVRVHEMFINDEGWPVVAPHRYAPRLTADGSPKAAALADKVVRPLVPGDYKLINHGKAISPEIVRSTPVRLHKNGEVSGSASGSWQFGGHNRISISIDGETYSGALSRQYNENLQDFVVTFSAVSEAGVAIWGSRLPDRHPCEVVDSVISDLSLGDTEHVTADMALPLEGTRGASIAWESSDPSVVTNEGVVTRPEAGSGNGSATLTATVSYEGISKTKTFEVTVLEMTPNDLRVHYAFDGDLSDATFQYPDGYPSGPYIDTFGGTVSFAPGVVGDAVVLDGASGVRLPNDIINSHEYTVSMWLKPSALTMFTTAFFGATSPNSWVSFVPRGGPWVGEASMVWSGALWYDAGTGIQIPVNEWSHVAFTVSAGNISVYINGEPRFVWGGFPDVFSAGTSLFSLGVNWWDLPYAGAMDELRVFGQALTDAQILELANP